MSDEIEQLIKEEYTIAELNDLINEGLCFEDFSYIYNSAKIKV